MSLINQLHAELDKYHLLQHAFYKDWSEGKLTKEDLQVYAQQYYHHVNAFPRYISSIHTQCQDISARQVLLGNLIEEEQGEENHPELWLRFVDHLGVKREDVQTSSLLPETTALVEGYFALAQTSYAKGLGALYAYERQVPAVATSKIEGLKCFYDLKDEEGVKFFTVHVKADEWHSEECLNLIEALPVEQQQEAFQGAVEGAKLLWQFLDGMQAVRH